MQPGNAGREPQRIQSVWMWVAVDKDGDEGLPAIKGADDTWLPLVGSDRTRVHDLNVLAGRVHRETGQRMELRRFDGPYVVEHVLLGSGDIPEVA